MIVYKKPNRLELMGVMAATNSFIHFNSSSRLAMMVHHIDQAVTPKNSDIPRIMTGLETQLDAFDIKMPVDAILIGVHRKFRRGFDQHAIKDNPFITVIYQCQETGEYSCLDITNFHSKHRVYGIRYILSPLLSQPGLFRPGLRIPKDTVLAWSPNIKEGGVFANGLSCNVANMSLPCTIEDGYGVSKSFCERASLLELPTVTASWGKKTYPLNIYGDDETFKAFPEVGDRIRDDGLVFAMREYNPTFDALEMTPRALREVDLIHDIRVYGVPGAIVHDVTVESGIGESKSKTVTSAAMSTQPERYINHIKDYYSGILSTYEGLLKSERNLRLSPRLIQLITRAYADTPNANKNKSNNTGGIIRRCYKGIPLDEYRVEIKCTREIPIGLGSKITGYHGDKGVICAIFEDEQMPVDMDGNRVDVIKFAKSTVARLNPGQLYEQYVAAASRDMSKWVRANFNVLPLESIWDRLMSFYQVASPMVFTALEEHYNNPEEQLRHIDSIITSGIYLYIPPDSAILGPTLFKNIEKVISPTYGPVTYRDLTGKMVTTKDKIFVGIQQMIILEKTDQHPMSVSSGLLQHHGLLAGSNKISRQGHPSKVQAVKIFSETEVRLYASTMGGLTMAKLITMANSPEAHKMVVRSLLNSPTPSNLPPIEGLPSGTARPLIFINNVLSGFGLGMRHKESIASAPLCRSDVPQSPQPIEEEVIHIAEPGVRVPSFKSERPKSFQDAEEALTFIKGD